MFHSFVCHRKPPCAQQGQAAPPSPKEKPVAEGDVLPHHKPLSRWVQACARWGRNLPSTRSTAPLWSLRAGISNRWPQSQNQSLLSVRGCIPWSPHPLQLAPAVRHREPLQSAWKSNLNSPAPTAFCIALYYNELLAGELRLQCTHESGLMNSFEQEGNPREHKGACKPSQCRRNDVFPDCTDFLQLTLLPAVQPPTFPTQK